MTVLQAAPSMRSPSRPELVLALVGGAGTPLPSLVDHLRQELTAFGYNSTEIRLSSLLENYSGWIAPPANDEIGRVSHLQNLGNLFRREGTGDGAALARAAIAAIREHRRATTGNPDSPADAHAYILRQLKLPEEVDLLRRVYGPAFFLVAGHATHDAREAAIAKRAAELAGKPDKERLFRGAASSIIEEDDKQDIALGQNTRDAYPKADLFVNMAHGHSRSAVGRFIELLFGHPFHTPSPDEYAMFQANAVSLRSADDSRQVGAVIVSLTRSDQNTVTNADVIAVGMNEVPRGGGGFYWDGASPDLRDQRLVYQGDDRPKSIKTSALAEPLARLADANLLSADLSQRSAKELADDLLPKLKGTQFMNIGEFSRPVHAEMSALIDAARRGVAVDGRSMYVTTFPCHNCAKHIIAAGIQQVVFLEPYPKSRAGHLYGEEIHAEFEGGNPPMGKVAFRAFTGIGPRLYADLFSMVERGNKKGLSLKHWENTKNSLSPPYVPPNSGLQYTAEERAALAILDVDVYRWDRDTLCPS